MQVSVWIRYIFGQSRAIHQVAESGSALWTGIGLVLLTAFARNYDQTFIVEKPLLWFFGPLLFSIVSGTWLYLIAYAIGARSRMKGENVARPGSWSGWRGFMGLFWMTAPIAWLYAIPVERFFDPVTAAKANVWLLAVVSLWRVLLMARVLQCLTTVPYLLALTWVLLAAALEVLVVFFFGGGLAEAVMRGMGGMRNSPAEDVLFKAMGSAFAAAFYMVPVLALLSFINPKRRLQPLPLPMAIPMHGGSLAVAALFWVFVSIVPQIELSRNVIVEKLLAERKPRVALDYLTAHHRNEFAPARVLPPKPFGWDVFKQIPACFDVVQPSDAPWVRAFLIERLDEMMIHYGPRWREAKPDQTDDEKISDIKDGLRWHGPDGEGCLKLIKGLERIPEGRAWLTTNQVFLRALQEYAGGGLLMMRQGSKSEDAQKADLLILSNHLQTLLPADMATNKQPVRP